ncbi:MAG: phospholipase D-like domain-containing protein, partial [Parabacteroides sp.]|nr:phospholipase D-like domain-containing protein [Parabacteroides sp.]
PYFLPTEAINQALQIAALGGIDVRLMLPKRSDTRTANMATHSFIDEMVKAGVKVYFYKPGFLHSKIIITDDLLTCIGSANMDFRSFEHNFEINAFVYQPSFAIQMREVFLQDMDNCERVIPSQWLKRSLKQRLAESFMRLFSPLL